MDKMLALAKWLISAGNKTVGLRGAVSWSGQKGKAVPKHLIHADVMMETYSALLKFMMGMNWSLVDSFRKGSVMQRFGGRLNKKDGLTRYGNSHVKDKTS